MTEPISCLSSMATRALLADLAEVYRERAGLRLRVESVGGVVAAERIRAGERFDVVVLASGVMETLAADGFVLAHSLLAIARSPMGVAVPSGRSQPSLVDEDAIKQTMLDATSIGYSTGPSGDMLKRLCRKWAIADEVAGRLVQARPGIPVASLLATGEAEVGFQQYSELAGVPGIDIVGRLPSELGTDTIFTSGVVATCDHVAAAGALVAFMGSDETIALKGRHGMEPV